MHTLSTDTVMTKSETLSLTYEIGKVTFVDLPDVFEYGSLLKGKASKMCITHRRPLKLCTVNEYFFPLQIQVAYFNGTTVRNKAVYLLEGQSWASKPLQNLTTDSNGLAAFSLNTASLPNNDLHLLVC